MTKLLEGYNVPTALSFKPLLPLKVSLNYNYIELD